MRTSISTNRSYEPPRPIPPGFALSWQPCWLRVPRWLDKNRSLVLFLSVVFLFVAFPLSRVAPPPGGRMPRSASRPFSSCLFPSSPCVLCRAAAGQRTSRSTPSSLRARPSAEATSSRATQRRWRAHPGRAPQRIWIPWSEANPGRRCYTCMRRRVSTSSILWLIHVDLS